MTYNTEADLHALLDDLSHGEHVKATWVYNTHRVTVEGLVYKNDLYCSCFHTIRCTDGSIESTLTSLEVTRYEEVTITRDDEDALHELIDSLEEGQAISAEWCSENGTMIVTGAAKSYGVHAWLLGYSYGTLRWRDGTLQSDLRSVTALRPVVQHWEREGDE